MHIRREDIPTRVEAPGAIARQLPDFGAAGGVDLGAEYFSLGAGTDLAPLLQGLEHDACHSAHWGYLISGEVVVTYTSGDEETCVGGDLFHWPGGHSVRVEEDAEIILFSPQVAHGAVLDHVAGKLAAV